MKFFLVFALLQQSAIQEVDGDHCEDLHQALQGAVTREDLGLQAEKPASLRQSMCLDIILKQFGKISIDTGSFSLPGDVLSNLANELIKAGCDAVDDKVGEVTEKGLDFVNDKINSVIDVPGVDVSAVVTGSIAKPKVGVNIKPSSDDYFWNLYNKTKPDNTSGEQ